MGRITRFRRVLLLSASSVALCILLGCKPEATPGLPVEAVTPARDEPADEEPMPASASVVSATTATAVTSADWTQFRGPNGSGVAEASGLPATWDSKQNVVWRTDLPGLGASSPIIVGNRVFVTCYSGYAESIDDPGNMEHLKRHVTCLDRHSGEVLWSKEFAANMPESEYVGGNSTRHGYASSTPATDGERVYAFFGISGVYGLSLDGEVVWRTDVGSGTHSWGTGTSPVLYANTVLVNAGVESKSLYALDKETGAVVWQTRDVEGSWGCPALVDVNEKQEVVLNLPRRLTAFDPETGAELWHCKGIDDGYLCPTPVVNDGIVYVIGARKGEGMAVRAGGRGDVTGTHILWTTDVGSNVTSPVYWDKHLYWTHESRGIAYCLDAATGRIVYDEKLTPKPGLIYASITAADGRLYIPSRENGTYVLAAQPKFEQIAVNVFQDDPSRTNACIAVSNNQIFMRTDKAIYCIGLN